MLDILSTTPYLPLCIGGVYGAYYFYRLGLPFKIISAYLGYSLLAQGLSTFLAMYGQNNMPVLHIYTMTGFVLKMAFLNVIFRGMVNRSVWLWVLGCFIVFAMLDVLWCRGAFAFSAEMLTIESIILIVFSLFFYWVNLGGFGKESDKKHQVAVSIVITGFFIYHSSTLLFFYFGDTLMNKDFPVELARSIWWRPHTLFMFVMYACFFIGLWKAPKKPRQKAL